MNENILSVWLTPVMCFTGVLLGFVAIAVLIHTSYTKQINLLKNEFMTHFSDIEKQQHNDRIDFLVYEKSLIHKEEEILEEKTSLRAYGLLELEFARLTSIVKEILERADESDVYPTIDTNLDELLMNYGNIQQNIETAAVDARIYIEIYNRESSSKEYKKELLTKLLDRSQDGHNYCYEAILKSPTRISRLQREYLELSSDYQVKGYVRY